MLHEKYFNIKSMIRITNYVNITLVNKQFNDKNFVHVDLKHHFCALFLCNQIKKVDCFSILFAKRTLL